VNRFAGKTALITGGASGIGLAVATRFADEGAAVAIVDIDTDALEQAAKQLVGNGASVHTAAGDVSDVADVEAAIASTTETLGPIDILVNNAGVFVLKPYVDHTDGDWRRILDINLDGTHNFLSRVLPGMIERGNGAVINISSVAALHYTVPHAAYAASKAAVIALTRDIGFEVAHHGVRVNCVAPGLIAVEKTVARLEHGTLEASTDFRPMGWGRPEDIAGVVSFLASDDARFVVGVTIPVSGGTDLLVSMAADDYRALMKA
jgi:NAD(P)-dependent dehydrogenase (short-subunit alcohol dehydrogenase family)